MVYVDDLSPGVPTDAQARRVGARNGDLWCHLFADTAEELRTFAARLGMRPEWLQHAGTEREHFDLTPGRRTRAIRLGAQEIDNRAVVALIRARRAAAIGGR
jgi:hypothetical protein